MAAIPPIWQDQAPPWWAHSQTVSITSSTSFSTQSITIVSPPIASSILFEPIDEPPLSRELSAFLRALEAARAQRPRLPYAAVANDPQAPALPRRPVARMLRVQHRAA